MKTELTLLTKDGAVYMAFRPSLSAQQYAGLRELVSTAVTAAEMRSLVTAWTSKEKLEVCFDEAVSSAWMRPD